MIGSSLPEYVFIRLSIFGLRLIAPASIAYIAASWYTGRWLFHAWLGYYALVEAAFYLFVYLPRSWILQKEATHPRMLTREEREALFNRCFTSVTDTGHATGWFFFSATKDIRHDNFVEWLLWALFSSTRDNQRDEWREEIEGYIHVIENLMGHKLEDGYNEALKCIKVSMDSVDGLHRPFLWYMIVAFVDSCTTIYLHFHGYQHYSHSRWYTFFPPQPLSVFARPSPDTRVSYWYRPHRSKTKHPIVFFHGIGIGLWTYVSFFADILKADPDVGILAIEDFAISMRISPPPLRREELLHAVHTVLDYHGFDKFVVVGHSYGTVIQAHIMRCPELARRVAAWLFIDSIPFLLHQPSVAYNFVYRLPKTANEWQLWYFASRDPDIARTLARNFFWTQNILFKDDLAGHKVGVVLSGRDQVVDATEVRKYLTNEDEPTFRWESKDGMLQVLWYPPLDHAQVFDRPETRLPMVTMLSKFLKVDESPRPSVIQNGYGTISS